MLHQLNLCYLKSGEVGCLEKVELVGEEGSLVAQHLRLVPNLRIIRLVSGQFIPHKHPCEPDSCYNHIGIVTYHVISQILAIIIYRIISYHVLQLSLFHNTKHRLESTNMRKSKRSNICVRKRLNILIKFAKNPHLRPNMRIRNDRLRICVRIIRICKKRAEILLSTLIYKVSLFEVKELGYLLRVRTNGR